MESRRQFDQAAGAFRFSRPKTEIGRVFGFPFRSVAAFRWVCELELPGQDVTFSIAVALDSTKSLKAQSSLTKAVAVPTGTVTLTDGTTTLGTAPLDANGNAMLTVTTLITVGPHSIVASYSGDANYPAFQSAAYVQTVGVNASAIAVPLFDEWWDKLLLSVMLVGLSGLCLRMRRAA